ncbi:MAG: hypothetical protein O6934_00795, partial [SAR324 cluster bacterium]|nr:hypothetical protein [SAR324 cluster bacterium]
MTATAQPVFAFRRTAPGMGLLWVAPPRRSSAGVAAHGVDTLRVPLPTGMLPIAVKQPRLVTDDAMTRSAKFAWRADWYIEIDMGNLGAMCNSIGQRDGGQDIPTAAECANIFTFTPDKFYQKR